MCLWRILKQVFLFRYLNISQNQLRSLPGSITQCRFDEIDISSNICLHRIANERFIQNLYIFCVGSLVNIASKAVLKHKLLYAPNIIPWTLVEFLDNANICICGTPVLSLMSVQGRFDLKDYTRILISDTQTKINFNCHFCSYACIKKIHKISAAWTPLQKLQLKKLNLHANEKDG